MKTICVIGLGYIGLPTAAMFASKGFNVIGTDVNENVINNLNNGKITIEEPNLDELVKEAVNNKNLCGKTTPVHADYYIICVPTPITADKKADMTYVEKAVLSVVPFLEKGNTVILESTSPPKTVENLMCPILEKTGLVIGEELFVAHSPERVLPGNILYELTHNDRVVGGINKKSAEAAADLYRAFVTGEIYLTSATTAEMCKLMENTYRDVNIALANEIAKISEGLGVNAWEAIALANRHPRVNIHQPGPGVGGHCIAVDPWFIVEKEPDKAEIIKLCRGTNDSMPDYTASRCESILGGINGKKIIVLGATYKPDVDDTRESPALLVADKLLEKGADVVVADPHVEKYRQNFNDLYVHANDAQLILLGVNHKEFAGILFDKLNMKEKNIFDTRNFFNGEKLKALGFNYYLLGDGR